MAGIVKQSAHLSNCPIFWGHLYLGSSHINGRSASLFNALVMDLKYMLTRMYKYDIIVTNDNKAGSLAVMGE